MYGALHRGLVILASLSVGAFGAGCGLQETADPPDFLDVSVDTTLVLGAEAPTTLAHALGDPVDVAVDSAGRVYVADGDIPAVQVYGPEGSHLRTIGREGPGPGEFRDVQEVHVHGDTLTAIGAAEVEQFRLNGGSLDTFGLPERASWRALRASPEQWIFGSYRGPGASDSLLQVYDRDFVPTGTAFAASAEFVDDNRVSRRAVGQHLGSLVMISDNRVLFAPYLYEGRIAVYSPSNGSWQKIQTWSGYTEGPAYTFEKVGSDAVPQGEVQIHSMEDGQHVVIDAMYFNKSLGIVQVDDVIYHFTAIARDDHRLFGAERYGPNGKRRGYVPLKEIATDENGVPTEVTPRPAAVGPDGALYFIDHGFGRVSRVVGLRLGIGDR